MAIDPNVPGLEVAILVNEQRLKEYQDRSEESEFQSHALPPNAVKHFVEAETGANFEILYRFSRPFQRDRSISMIVTIDGRDVDEPLVRPHELYEEDGHVSAGSISNIGSNFFLQKYCFSSLDIKESDGTPVPEAVKRKLEPVGTILLKFHFVENARRNQTVEHEGKTLECLGSVSEKAVKGEALSHAVSLAEAEPIHDLEFFDAEYADDGKPFAIFSFQYRSLAALKALCVVPRTPEPLDLMACDADVIRTSSSAYIQRMFAHWKRQEHIRQRLKRERSGSATVVGDDDTLGNNEEDDEVIFIGVRPSQKRKKRERQLPREQDEVVELD